MCVWEGERFSSVVYLITHEKDPRYIWISIRWFSFYKRNWYVSNYICILFEDSKPNQRTILHIKIFHKIPWKSCLLHWLFTFISTLILIYLLCWGGGFSHVGNLRKQEHWLTDIILQHLNKQKKAGEEKRKISGVVGREENTS